jgi:hypothetical protein
MHIFFKRIACWYSDRAKKKQCKTEARVQLLSLSYEMGSAMYVFSYSHKNGVEGNFHMHSSYGLSQLGNKV